MNVLIVDTFYEAFLQRLYAAAPQLASRPYGEQWRALMDTHFGTADAYSHYLGALGHRAHELVVNCRPLQQAWAREHGVRGLLRAPSAARTVLAQADELRPDVVYVQNLFALDDRTLERLRRGRLLVGQIASELPGDDRLRRFDLIVSSFPHYVERLRARGLAAEYLAIGFDPRVLDRLGDAAPAADVVFVGSLHRRQHARGNAVLAEAAERLDLDLWGYGAEEWPPESPVRRRYRGEAWGLEMYRVLAGARIALNRHIDVAEDHANNMRLFEATGVGTLLLTDAKSDLGRLFEPGAEVVAYGDADELVELARHLLEHEDERRAIAAAGQRRTLADHSYAVRMAELAAILSDRARDTMPR